MVGAAPTTDAAKAATATNFILNNGAVLRGKKMDNGRVDPDNKQRGGGSSLIKELYMIEEEGKSPVKGEINEKRET